MRARILGCAAGAAFALALAAPLAHAGVVNPDISLIGQPVATWNDDPRDYRNFRRVNFDVGETELVFDSALNPYARGYATLSLSNGGIDVEEAYFTILRGLPAGIEIKGGKYRVGFGKLNPQHPHTYPFVERFHVLAKLLPGDDSYDETGVNISGRIPAPGDIALTASADVLQGDSFAPSSPNLPLVSATTAAGAVRPSRPHNAFVGRLSAFVPIGDRSGLELGTSATQGTNDAYWNTLTSIAGADVKLKLWTSDNANLLVQGEAISEVRQSHNLDGAADSYWRPNGGYVFANYSWRQRYNAGVSYERSQSDLGVGHDAAYGAFAGLALMEETTWFRLGFEHAIGAKNADGSAQTPDINTIRLGIVYSMGPHKAHQF